MLLRPSPSHRSRRRERSTGSPAVGVPIERGFRGTTLDSSKHAVCRYWLLNMERVIPEKPEYWQWSRRVLLSGYPPFPQTSYSVRTSGQRGRNRSVELMHIGTCCLDRSNAISGCRRAYHPREQRKPSRSQVYHGFRATPAVGEYGHTPDVVLWYAKLARTEIEGWLGNPVDPCLLVASSPSS